MIFTSLSPNHINQELQQNAVDSWINLGHKVVSINHKSEQEKINIKGVEFIEPKRTGVDIYGKHYIPVSEFFTPILEVGGGYIINSDIILKGLPSITDKTLIFNRHDFEKDINQSYPFKSGFDGFYLTPKDCDLPETNLCLGQCHWDYWLPIMLINRKTRLYRPVAKYLFHKKHQLQYTHESWKRTAEIFSKETGMRGTPEGVSRKAYSIIYSKIINI